MDVLNRIKSKKYALAGTIVLTIALLAAATTTYMKVYATEEYWNLKIGDEVYAVFTSENSAKQVVKDVKNHYVKEGAEVKAIACTPEMKVEMQEYRVSEKPEVAEVSTTVDKILSGEEKPVEYTIKEGDTPWDIAQENKTTVENLQKMNPELDFEKFLPGEKVTLTEVDPIVDVKVTQKVTGEETISYETEERETDELYEGETEVEQEGKDGKKQVTSMVTTVNGKVTDKDVLESKVIKSAQKKIVLVGTKEETPAATSYSGGSASYSGTVYSGSGSAIANYALQFVGNPYVYGGSSLTNGADCSGFVYSVYRNCGYSVPRTGQGGCGRSVSLSAAKAGDIIIYSGHVSIYIGGGQEVHAVNEGMGIAVTSVGYTGSVLDVRRVVE